MWFKQIVNSAVETIMIIKWFKCSISVVGWGQSWKRDDQCNDELSEGWLWWCHKGMEHYAERRKYRAILVQFQRDSYKPVFQIGKHVGQ